MEEIKGTKEELEGEITKDDLKGSEEGDSKMNNSNNENNSRLRKRKRRFF